MAAVAPPRCLKAFLAELSPHPEFRTSFETYDNEGAPMVFLTLHSKDGRDMLRFFKGEEPQVPEPDHVRHAIAVPNHHEDNAECGCLGLGLNAE